MHHRPNVALSRQSRPYINLRRVVACLDAVTPSAEPASEEGVMTGPTDRLLSNVEQYYTAKLAEHGPRARGVDWSSESSQLLRFEKLLEVCDLSVPFSLIDYGCGYGALLPFLRER